MIGIFNLRKQFFGFFVILFMRCLGSEKNSTFPILAPYEITNNPQQIDTNIVMFKNNGIGQAYAGQAYNNHPASCIHKQLVSLTFAVVCKLIPYPSNGMKINRVFLIGFKI